MDSKRVWLLIKDLFNNAPKSELENLSPVVFYWDHVHIDGKSALSFETDYLSNKIENWCNELRLGMQESYLKGGFFTLMLVNIDGVDKLMMTLYNKSNNHIESSTSCLEMKDFIYNEEVPLCLLYNYEIENEIGH